MARTTLQQTRLLNYQPYQIDTATNLGIGLFGRNPAVRHVSCATDGILDLMTLAGHQIEESTLLYRAGDEAHALARRLIRQGYRLFYSYPLPEGQYEDAELLVPTSLWRSLNAKSQLHRVVPRQHLAPRSIVTCAEARARPFIGPVWLKLASDDATGWGIAVRYCADAEAYQSALVELGALGGDGPLLVEEHVDSVRSWGVNFVVRIDDVVFAGAAEQIFERPGRLSGSVVESGDSPARELAELAVTVGTAAKAAGFLGMAAFDVGLARDGRLVVFDPNFRMTSSTHQALVHDSAARRCGMPVSASVNIGSPMPFPEIASRLADWISDGRFVPTRLMDARHLETAGGVSQVAGFMMGSSRDDAAGSVARFKEALRP